MDKVFYTYIYLDTRKPGVYNYGNYSFDYEPMYVGKGKNNRWRDHWNYYKNWLGYKIKHIRESGLEPKIIFQGENLDEKSAFNLEIELIITIGRRDLGTGPLVNFTEGGEGASGHIYTKKMKDKMRENFKNPIIRKKISEGLKKHYEDNPEAKNRLSEIKKKYYEDNPEVRKSFSENNPMKNPGVRKKAVLEYKKHLKNHPDFRKKLSDGIKKHYKEHPEVRDVMSKERKKYFEDNPDFRNKISEGIKKHYKEHPETRKKISDREKNKLKLGIHSFQQNKNPMHIEECRLKMVETRRRNGTYKGRPITEEEKENTSKRMMGENNPMKNPEIAKKSSKGRKKYFETEENRKKSSEISKQYFADPNNRKKQSDIMKEYYRKEKETCRA